MSDLVDPSEFGLDLRVRWRDREIDVVACTNTSEGAPAHPHLVVQATLPTELVTFSRRETRAWFRDWVTLAAQQIDDETSAHEDTGVEIDLSAAQNVADELFEIFY